MSSVVLGGNGLKEAYMKLTSFGGIQITVTAQAGTDGKVLEVMSVDIAAENRKEPVHMETQKDETVDQFCIRIRSMLRSLWNNEPRVLMAQTVGDIAKAQAEQKRKDMTWEEQKAALMAKSNSMSVDSKPDSKDSKLVESKK